MMTLTGPYLGAQAARPACSALIPRHQGKAGASRGPGGVQSKSSFLVLIGAGFGLLGVAAGAVGSHGLAPHTPAQRIAVFELAAQYQMYHALALVMVGALYERWGGRLVLAAGCLFAAGIILFSGSLYVLVLADVSSAGRLTPIGGMAFLAGWLLLAGGALAVRRRARTRRGSEPE